MAARPLCFLRVEASLIGEQTVVEAITVPYSGLIQIGKVMLFEDIDAGEDLHTCIRYAWFQTGIDYSHGRDCLRGGGGYLAA